MISGFFSRLKIGAKISLLPLLAVAGLLVIAGVDLFLRRQLQEVTLVLQKTHEVALALSEEGHLQQKYIANPVETISEQIKDKDARIREVLSDRNMEAWNSGLALQLQKIETRHAEHHEVFQKARDVVLAIASVQQELTQLFHESDDLAHKKVDEISMRISLLMLEGKELSPAKRELRNSLREFVGLSSDAMLNINELLFFSDPSAYEEAEKRRQRNLALVMRACQALAIATDDPGDSGLWQEIEKKYERITVLRTAFFEAWKARQQLAAALKSRDAEIQDDLEMLTVNVNTQVNRLLHRHKVASTATIALCLLFLLLLSSLLIRHITQPLLALTAAMERFKKGGNAPVNVNSRDEIGVMAATFNDMMVYRKEAEALIRSNERMYRRLIESTNTIPWELDLQSSKFTYMGHQAEKVFGYPVESWLDIQSWIDRLHPEDRQSAVSFCQQETARGADHDFVYRALHCDGSTRWIRDVVSVVMGDEKALKLVGFMHDITEQKVAEEAKANLEERLQQAQKMEAIGTLAGGIAHDFNNILGAILGYADMARDDLPPGSTVAKDLGNVLQAAHRAKDLVKQILAFSRQSQTNRMLLQPAIIVKEVVKLLKSSIPSTIEIKHSISPKCGVICADPTEIHQIVMNLCTNAFQAMEEQGGILEIVVEKQEIDSSPSSCITELQAGAYLVITVRDNGPGVSPEIIDKIFDPYFTTKEVGKGTGMGLAIIHGIVTSLGGSIGVESGPGQGAVFQIYLPLVEGEAELQQDKAEEIPAGRERILLVDDEQIFVDMGQEMLERLGYRVTVKTRSFEALEAFQNQPHSFDLIITDMTMPGMTGTDLARRMMQIRPDLPIILCTGYSGLIDEERAAQLGIKGFALKPLIKKEMAKLIRTVLDG